MKSIKSKMLLSFCTVGAISIIVLAVAVSVKIRENLLILSKNLTSSTIEQTYETLKMPHQTFELLIREEIQHAIFDMNNTPTLVANLESGRLKALSNDLKFASQKNNIDIAIVVNFRGQLEASFPENLNDFAIEDYITSWDFGKVTLQRASEEQADVQSPIWETFSHHNIDTLHMLGLDSTNIPEEGALSIVAASIIKNDFAEPIGILFAGKLLNNYQRPLQRLHDIAGYASALYINSTPIALAGFPAAGEDESDLLPFQITPDMQADVSQTGRSTARTLSSAGDTYFTACSALKSFTTATIGMLCVGLPEGHVTRASQTILNYGAEARKDVSNWILLIGITSLVFFALASLVIATRIVTPIKQLSAHAKKIALGNFQDDLLHTARDEIGELSASLREVVNALREVAATAEATAVGRLQQHITPRSEQDTLGHALQYMSIYLRNMADMAEAISQGDLTRSIDVRSDDDILGYALRAMTDGLRTLIMQIKHSMEQLTSTEAQIASLTKNQMRIVTDVYKSTQDMTGTMTGMRLNVEDVAQSMETLSASVEETSISVTQLTQSIAQIASNTTHLTQQTHLTIEHIEQVVSSVESIADNTDTSEQLSEATMQDALEGQQAVAHVRSSMETIQHTMTTAVEAITRFSQRSQEIDKILDVIREITDRTSLLALNASIIAAQAGTHGRGFAVVAEEIKSLSSGVIVSTKDIAAIVQNLQQDTNTVVQTVHDGVKDVQQGMERTQEAQGVLNKIINSVQRSSTLVTQIAEALHGLTDISHQMSSAMDRVNAIADHITTATGEQEAGTGQIHEAISHINNMTSQIQKATANQLIGVQHVLDATDTVTGLIDENLQNSEQITAISEELSSQATLLLHSVDRFKLLSK